jgi:hypothetical protein
MIINGQPIVGAVDEATLDRIIKLHVDHAKDALGHGLKRAEIYPTVMSMATGDERADPASIPQVMHIEPRQDERARSVAAACRRHDGKGAAQLAGALAGDPKHRAAEVCAGEGIDLR